MATATPLARPPPADRHDDRGHVRQVLGDLEPDRTLAGDDPVVVVRRDDREPAFGGDLLGPHAALIGGGPDGDDLRAVRGDALALDRRARRSA